MMNAQKFDDLGRTWLHHPLYTSNLAPYGFWLFRYLKNRLEGCIFGDSEELIWVIEEAFADLNIEQRLKVYDEWIRRSRQALMEEESIYNDVKGPIQIESVENCFLRAQRYCSKEAGSK
jgi:hypothetical protein